MHRRHRRCSQQSPHPNPNPPLPQAAAIAAALSGGSSLDSRLAAASVIDRLNQTLEASAMAASQPRSVNEWTALSAELEINDFVQNAR